MKSFKIIALVASNIMLSHMLHASAPAQQSMNDVMNAIAQDNKALREERTQLQKERDQLTLQIAVYLSQEKPGCCDKIGNTCRPMGDRADNWCNHWLAKPFRQATCQEFRAEEDVAIGCCTLGAGFTCCLPFNIIRGAICGTTYVCCDAECSRNCLNVKDED